MDFKILFTYKTHSMQCILRKFIIIIIICSSSSSRVIKLSALSISCHYIYTSYFQSLYRRLFQILIISSPSFLFRFF